MPRRSEHEDQGVEVVEAMTERMVVVGGDAAGMSAASQAKRLAGDKLEVIAFERMLADVEAIDLQAGTVAVG